MTDADDARRVTSSIVAYFSDLEDPRVARTRKHSLHNLLTIAFVAVICGAEGWDQIEEFAKAREPWLRSFLDLPAGVPSDDTFRRVFSALNAKRFSRCFSAWMQALSGSVQGKQIAIDGKTLRHSFDRASERSPLHLVHAWVVEQNLLLGQVATDAKSNEITAIPALLDLIDVRGAIVTIDAIGCQTAIAKKIVERGGDYALAIKDNHPTLHREVAHRFELRGGSADVMSFEQTDKGHGRIEVRRVDAMDADWYLDVTSWKGLQTFVRVQRERTLGDKTTTECAHYLCTLSKSRVDRIAQSIRGHWSVENVLHWSLDVTMREDASRIRNAAENFALLRRTALTLLRRDKTSRGTGPIKRFRAALDPDYILKILALAICSTPETN